MDVATTFLPLLQVFAGEMTRPTFQNFTQLAAGWLLAPRRTILGVLRAADCDKHHSAFHRIFASARWSLDGVGLALFDLIAQARVEVKLVGDDTLVPRAGLKVFGACMHRDPLLSSHSHTVTRWGNCWVVLCVLIESRHFPGRWFSLPVLFRLYLNKKSAEKWERPYQPKFDLMLSMLELLNSHIAGTGKKLHFIGDSAYTSPVHLNRIPTSIDVTGRTVANVRMNEPPPLNESKRPGPPRKRGQPISKPIEALQTQQWPCVEMELYEGRTYKMRVAEQTGQFYKAPGRDVKVVVAEHLSGGRGVETFYTTKVESIAEEVQKDYSRRWSVEVTNHDGKQHLGVTEPQNRTTLAVERTAPTGFLLYSLVVWWHETVLETPAPALRDWSGKSQPSFADMLAALRSETLSCTHETNYSTPDTPPGVQKFIRYLTRLLSLAA